MTCAQDHRSWPKSTAATSLSWEERFDLDVTYVDHADDLWLDLKIILPRPSLEVFAKSDIEGEVISTMTMFVADHHRKTASPKNRLDDRWSDLWDSWQHSPATLKIGEHDGADPTTVRHWVYLEDPENPVGIAGLSDLGERELNASIVLAPGYHAPWRSKHS